MEHTTNKLLIHTKLVFRSMMQLNAPTSTQLMAVYGVSMRYSLRQLSVLLPIKVSYITDLRNYIKYLNLYI